MSDQSVAKSINSSIIRHLATECGFDLAGVAAPLLTGLLISRTGSYAPGFALAAAVLFAGIFCYWFIVGDLHPDQAELQH